MFLEQVELLERWGCFDKEWKEGEVEVEFDILRSHENCEKVENLHL